MDSIFEINEEWVSAFTFFAFLGAFGYAYCLREEPEPQVEETGPLKKKDMKAVKKLGEDLHKAIDKIVKIEEKLNAIENKPSMADVLKRGANNAVSSAASIKP